MRDLGLPREVRPTRPQYCLDFAVASLATRHTPLRPKIIRKENWSERRQWFDITTFMTTFYYCSANFHSNWAVTMYGGLVCQKSSVFLKIWSSVLFRSMNEP